MPDTGTVRTIAAVTGTRADFGLLTPVLHAISETPGLALRLVATGAHLSPAFGDTWREIERAGFTIDDRVELPLDGDDAVSVATSVGNGVIGFAASLRQFSPDILLLLGDRYETLAAAQAALFAQIPVAHIAGGDVTEGAIDDSMRHAISKMAHIHFPTNEAAAARLLQLGEDPAHIHCVGSPGLDLLARTKRLSRSELERRLGFTFRDRNVIVTFHPETAERADPSVQFAAVLKAVDALGAETGVILTYANADAGGRRLIEMAEEFAAGRENAIAVASLGSELYFSVLAAVDGVVGNSSSGLYEAPSIPVATVNVGTRQTGRPRARSVIDCGYDAGEIEAAIHRAFDLDLAGTVNPYGDGKAAPRIVDILKSIPNPAGLIKKRFFDLAEEAR